MIRIVLFSIVMVFLETISSADEISDHIMAEIRGECDADSESIAVLWQDSGSSRTQLITYLSHDGHHGNVQVIQKHDGFVVGYWQNKLGNSEPLISISQDIEWVRGPWEGNHPNLIAKAKAIHEDGSEELLWELTEESDNGLYKNGFYETQHFGCCDGWTVFSLHDVNTGRVVMTYDDTLIILDESHPFRWKSPRYFGAVSYGGYNQIPDQWLRDSLMLTRISYASHDSSLASLTIRTVTERAITAHYDYGCDRSTLTLVPTASALAEIATNPAGYLVTSDRIIKLTPQPPFCLRIQYQCNTFPVFIIPFWKDDFLLGKTKFQDYEVMRMK